MKLKRSLGQNFFTNPRLAEKIVDQVLAEPVDSLLEIGPGDGYFTALFAEKVPKIVVIEKDTELVEMLKLKLPKIEVVNADILDIHASDLQNVSDETVCFGSLPYNISKRIISKFLTETNIERFFFIIQKEVAQKYILTESDTSILSITAKLYADSKIIMDIKPGAFIPAPKVTSSFIQFRRNTNVQTVKDQGLFLRLVKAAFISPRKMLRNNLKDFNITDEQVLNKRAQQLSFNDFVVLANSL